MSCLRAESRHEYKPLESEGGFAQFALAAEVLDPDKGFYKNDSLKIKVELQVEVRHSNKLSLKQKKSKVPQALPGLYMLPHNSPTCTLVLQ